MNRSKSSAVFYTSLCSDIIQNQDNQQDNFIHNLISKRYHTIYTNSNHFNEGLIQQIQQKDHLSSRQKYIQPNLINHDIKNTNHARSSSQDFCYSSLLKQVTDSKHFKQLAQYIPLQNCQKIIQNYSQTFSAFNNITSKNKKKYPLNNCNDNHEHNHNHKKNPNNINGKKIKNYKRHPTDKNNIPQKGSDQHQDILPCLNETQINNNSIFFNIKALQKHPSLQTNPSTPKNQEGGWEEEYQDHSSQGYINIKKRVERNIGYNDLRCQKSLEKNIQNLVEQQVNKREWVNLKMKARSLENSVSILRKQKKLYTMKLLQYQIQMDKLIYQLELLRAESKNILCNNCNSNINTISNMSNTNNTNNNNSNSQLRHTFKGSTNSHNSCNSSCSFPPNIHQQLEDLRQAMLEQKQSKQAAHKQRDLLIKQLNQALCNHQLQTNGLTSELKWAENKITEFQKQKILLYQLHKEQTAKIDELLKNIFSNQHNIKQLSFFIQQISHQFQQSMQTSCELQQEAHRLKKEISQLNQECDLLFDALQSTRYDLEIQKNRCINLQKTVQEKDAIIQQMSKEAHEYRSKLQDFVCDNEEVKSIFNRYEDRILQLQSIIRTKEENIQNLYIKIDSLSISIQQIKSNQNNKTTIIQTQNHQLIQQINMLEQKYNAHQKYLQQAYCLLKIPLNNPSFPCPSLYSQEPILQEIQTLLQHNKYNSQIVGDYRQILEMFNISYRDELYHQKLLLEITEFRNNIANLVKKLKIMEKKVSFLAEQNKKYVNIIKNGCEDSVHQLQRLVQEQNEEIVKYRLHLQNISFGRYQKREF